MRDKNMATITIISENSPGVLYRIANMFLRRKVNIESLTVFRIGKSNLSKFTIMVKDETHVVKKIVKQLEKIIEVIEVKA